MDCIEFIKLEQISSLAKQTFLTLKFTKHTWFWNQVQKNLSIKPQILVLFAFNQCWNMRSILVLKNQNYEKMKKVATDLRTLLQGKYSNELLGTMGEKIVCVPLQKEKKIFSGRLLFYYTHTHTCTHIYVFIFINIYYYIIISPLQCMIIF